MSMMNGLLNMLCLGQQSREMVTKDRKKRLNRKQKYGKQQIISHEQRLLTDSDYQTKKLMQTRMKANLCQAKRMSNPEYRRRHLILKRLNRANKLLTVTVNKTDGLTKNQRYYRLNKAKMILRAKERRMQKTGDPFYREQEKIRVRKILKLNEKYREINRLRALRRRKQIRLEQSCREKDNILKKVIRSHDDTDLPAHIKRQMRKQRVQRIMESKHKMVNNKCLTEQQKYGMRRTRLIAICRQRRITLAWQQKMQLQSKKSLLDIKLLFNKAEHQIKKSLGQMRHLHKNLVRQMENCLQCIPTDSRATEEDIHAAFEGLRYHTSSSEPYFWESSSKLCDSEIVIPVDNEGKARLFKLVSEDDTSKNEEHLVPTSKKTDNTKKWECNPQICNLDLELINNTVLLFRQIISAKSYETFYSEINECNYETRNNKLGHSIHCSPEAGCNNLFRSARILSCHFPHLRSIVRRIYDLRRLSICIKAIRHSMSNGKFEELDRAIEDLINTMDKICIARDVEKNATGCEESTNALIEATDENVIMERYGKALRQVADIRDAYTTRSCDICEQLRKDLRSLKYYENKKGFNNEQMEIVIEKLYQSKTQHEELDEFMNSIMICGYCSDKLRGNKDVARNALNRMSVEPTPECISCLNLFERSLIKCCMTCITIVRLGQISKKLRPQKELTSALKGRIAYLPIDISANAKFLPENLLSVDSLVLLVGSQPTSKQRVWTSVVDLRKVHTALTWLRLNNKLYKDVPAYSVEDIEKIIDERLSNSVAETIDAETDKAILKKLNEASQSFLYENFSVQPLSTDFPADALVDYQFNKINGDSCDIFETDLDCKAFPELFPSGEFGMRDTKRVTRISNSEYIKSRLLNKNPKFRLNINYLFHCFQIQEVSNMCHSVGHMLRSVTGESLSARSFLKRLENKDGEMASNMFSLLANIRGTREYFAKLGMDLRWMIKRLGPPTLFITCSTAEWFSDSFICYLREINSSVPGIQKMTPAELCAMDPVNVSIHFHKKWDAIFNKLIRSKENPIFGHVSDFCWRIEYQQRGAPHVHCLLWIKDAPMIGKNPVCEIKKYINSIVTCAKPNKEKSPTLYNLVQKFQTHTCNQYCTKTFKKGSKFFKKCRFGFPRPIKTDIEFNDIIDCLAVNTNKQPRKRLYNLKRTDEEKCINDYNAALLLANEANVDVQYVAHSGSRLSYYLSEYVTKHERCEQDDMWRDIFSSTKSLGSNAMSFLLKSIKSRQIGSNEAADRLLGHKLFSKSRQLRFADLQSKNKTKRLLKPVNELKNLLEISPDSQDIYQPHWVLDVYPDRPDSMQSCCLYDFLSLYEREKSVAGTNEPLQLKTLDFYLRKRMAAPYIVTHQIINPNQTEEKKEMYYFYLLKLFKPWRQESDLISSYTTYYETFVSESENLPAMVEYHNAQVYKSQQDEKLENEIKERAKQLKAAEELINEDVEESAFNGCKQDQTSNAMEDLILAHKYATKKDIEDENDLMLAYKSLNADQLRIVDKVASTILNDREPINLLVSGQGGVGKSRVINVLNRLISKNCPTSSLPVVVSAPTGLAAFNIEGSTIHRVLCLPVEHGKPPDYTKLNQDQLIVIKTTLKNLKLLIIDEVSMISSLTLLYIHLRLTEVMAVDAPFGGISIVIFADFLQLPPCKGSQPFVSVSFLEAKQRIGAIATIDLWKNFSYDELTVNVRQQGDEEYANVLSDIRLGKITDTHKLLLKSRLIASGRRATVAEICERYNNLVQNNVSTLILMPKTVLCDEINIALMKLSNKESHILEAIDKLDTVVESTSLKRVEKAYQKTCTDTTRTAGLEKSLQLCIGARVMLKRNKNVEAGLVNGSLGTVLGFNASKVNDNNASIEYIEVLFDTTEEPVKIGRESFTFEVLKTIYYTRKQFPLMLAFAVTIHKSQGLSLPSAIVDVGQFTFGCGMTYVALSRVTSLSGLHLIDIDTSKIKCDERAVEEYNRLRQLYTPHLGQMIAMQQCKKQTTEQKKTSRSAVPVCHSMFQHTVETVNDKSLQPVVVINMYQFCRVSSLDVEFQKLRCNTLNLRFFHTQKCTRRQAKNSINHLLANEIHSRTGVLTAVYVLPIIGDGNCLFRALSLALTGCQSQHALIRSYIVNHMAIDSIHNSMQRLVESREGVDTDFNEYLLEMQKLGTWGTEQEIISAAHLFECSIICYSQYGTNNRFCLQHFPPHFVTSANCTHSCNHNSLYLVNRTGSHYECAIVTESLINMEE